MALRSAFAPRAIPTTCTSLCRFIMYVTLPILRIGASVAKPSSFPRPLRPPRARAALRARLRGAWIENLTSKRIHDVSLDVFAIRAREEDITAEIDDEQSAQGVTGDRRGRHGVESSTRAVDR